MGEEHPRLTLPEASFRMDQLTTEGEMPSVISGPNILLVIMFLEVCILVTSTGLIILCFRTRNCGFLLPSVKRRKANDLA